MILGIKVEVAVIQEEDQISTGKLLEMATFDKP